MSISLWLARWSFHSHRAVFYEDLAEAVFEGDPLADRIEELAARAADERDVQAPLFQLWFDRMDDCSFSDALSGTVPESDLMIIQAAEESGDLVTGLTFTAKVIAATTTMRKVIRQAIAGFIGLSALQIVLLMGLSFWGIGLIEAIVPPNAWPWLGLQLKALANFITESGATLSICLIVIAIVYIWSLRNWYGRARNQFDKYVPFYTVYRDFTGAMFLVSLAALMKNGKALNDALEVLSERASPWLLWHIREIQFRLDYETESAGYAFRTGMFDRRLTWRIIDFGKRAGADFAIAMEKVGIKSIDKVMESVKARAAKLNRFLIYLNASMIMFIVAGALSTIYEAQEVLQKQITSSQSQVRSK